MHVLLLAVPLFIQANAAVNAKCRSPPCTRPPVNPCTAEGVVRARHAAVAGLMIEMGATWKHSVKNKVSTEDPYAKTDFKDWISDRCTEDLFVAAARRAARKAWSLRSKPLEISRKAVKAARNAGAGKMVSLRVSIAAATAAAQRLDYGPERLAKVAASALSSVKLPVTCSRTSAIHAGRSAAKSALAAGFDCYTVGQRAIDAAAGAGANWKDSWTLFQEILLSCPRPRSERAANIDGGD